MDVECRQLVDFVEEVEEQLRSDRYRGFMNRAWPWFLAALIAVVIGWLGAWGYNTWRERNIGRASIAYDKAVNALVQGDQTGAYTTFDQVGKTGPAGYRTLALMQQGGMRLVAGKTAEAIGFYDAAAKVAPNLVLGDLARLRAAQILLDTAPYAQLETRLKALMGDKRPFDLDARETLAMAKLLAGRTTEARGDLNALMLTLGVTQTMRERAQAAIGLIDSGQSGVVAQVAKAAALLPPPPPATVSGVGAQSQDPSASQGAPDNGQDGPPGNAQ
jgi:hypothetical protein